MNLIEFAFYLLIIGILLFAFSLISPLFNLFKKSYKRAKHSRINKKINSIEEKLERKKESVKRKAGFKLNLFKEDISRKSKILPNGKKRDAQINILLRKSKILIEEMKYDDAEMFLIKALSEDENHSKTNELLGHVYLLQGKTRKSEIIFHRLLEKGHDNDFVLGKMGLCKASNEDHEKAINFFEKALEKNRGSHFLLFNLSKSLFKIGKKDKALKKIETAISFSPRNKEILYTAAEIYEKFGEKEKAHKIYESILKMFPKDKVAFSMLRKTKSDKNRKDSEIEEN